jgi:hypothetical protein
VAVRQAGRRERSRRFRYAALTTALLVVVMGCGSPGSRTSAAPSGYAAQVQQETDRVAELVLPALVGDLGVQVFAGRSGFISCDVSGWRYEGDGDLVGGPDPATVTDALAEVMGGSDLEVEVRGDGSVVGRRGRLSLLVGAPTGPAGTTLRHYTFKNDCTAYSQDDEAYAGSATGTDYAQFVPAEARYTP